MVRTASIGKRPGRCEVHRTGSNVQQGTFHLPQLPAPTAPRRQCHLSAGSRAGSSTAKHRPQLLRSLSTTTCGCHAHGRLHSRTDGVHRQAARAEQQCWWDARCLLLHPHRMHTAAAVRQGFTSPAEVLYPLISVALHRRIHPLLPHIPFLALLSQGHRSTQAQILMAIMGAQ